MATAESVKTSASDEVAMRDRLARAGTNASGMSTEEVQYWVQKLDAEESERHLSYVKYLFGRANCPLRHRRRLKDLDVNKCPPWAEVHAKLIGRLDRPFLVALLGRRGNGKTQMAVSVINRACHLEKSCRYVKLLDLYREIRRTYGVKGKSEADVIDELAALDLLVIDECHQRGETEWEQYTIANLIDRRYDAMKRTILISNQDAAEFAATMGDSIVSRIHEDGAAIKCDWESFRNKGMWDETP